MCNFYSDRLKEMQILLSNSQAEPGRAVRQAQEDISQPRTSFFADIGTVCALFQLISISFSNTRGVILQIW